MPTLTALMTRGSVLHERQQAFERGFTAGLDGQRFTLDREVFAAIRARHDLKAIWSTIVTEPDDNAKLEKTAAIGLTLQSHVTRLERGDDGKLTVNGCPNAGHCTKVCVLDNGNGAYPTVQRARNARLDYFVTAPMLAIAQYGWEAGRAYADGVGLNRPNVNQDVDWQAVLGDTFEQLPIVSYGYTKRPDVLADPRGGHNGNYHESYSLSEADDLTDSGHVARLQAFLDRGGNIAVVTNRGKTQDVHQFAERPYWPLEARVVDADKTDAWMIEHRGVIGDLSAKGKARSLIGTSDFVRVVY